MMVDKEIDGLMREAERLGSGCSLPPPLPASLAGFSAVIRQQALENKRGRQGMRRGMIRFMCTLIEPRRRDRNGSIKTNAQQRPKISSSCLEQRECI